MFLYLKCYKAFLKAKFKEDVTDILLEKWLDTNIKYHQVDNCYF